MQGDNRRQRETTGDKTTSEPKKPTTPTNTRPTWRETSGDNGRQRETRPLQSPRSRPHQPTPNPHMKGDNGRQRETRPLQSPRSRPHQPPPTPHMKGDNRRQWETTGDKTTSEPKKPTTPTNTHPTWRETTGGNRRQRETKPLQSPRWRPHQPTPTPHMKGDTRTLQSPRSRPHQPTPRRPDLKLH